MTGSKDRIRGALVAPLSRIGWKLAALVAVLAVIGATSAAAGIIVYEKPQPFAATFEARAVGDPSITSCPALGPDGQKTEGRYRGTMTIAGEEYAFNFTTLEALVDRSAGLGSADGRWQLTDPRTGDVVGSGELIATVTIDPPDPDLELNGLLIGQTEPPDPDMPAEKLLGTVTVTITDGTHVTGTVGDPEGMPGAGVLLPAVRC